MIDGTRPTPYALVRDDSQGAWLEFASPKQILSTYRLSEVLPILHEADGIVRRTGMTAVGMIAYEAAPAFDHSLPSVHDSGFPLVWFGIFESPLMREVACTQKPPSSALEWTASLTRAEYRERVCRIRDYIGNGDSYQVNFTYRLRAQDAGNPLALFNAMAGDGRAPYAAYLDIGEWEICSASPELFLRLDGEQVESRPMKGTAARGLWCEQDDARRSALMASEKERAENLMIVDMVRNDLGRIAVPGSVSVPSLFDVERYPTVWQMTSTVRARTREPLARVLQATFPPASITGAPKRRTMEIIAELEDSPRRVYTGAIGTIEPGGRARFSVAIRTALVHRPSGRVEYGVGGGIVWDSDPDREWKETEAKAQVLRSRPKEFDLFETMLWTVPGGCALLLRHLRRLARSAEYFGFAFDPARVHGELDLAAQRMGAGSHRVRLSVSRDGTATVEARPIDSSSVGFGRVALAAAPIDSGDVFLYHKTTRRQVYESALRARPGYDDVLLYNGRGEATESTIANVAAEIDGQLCTPPIECGLLPGVQREALLEQGVLVERVVTIEDLIQSSRVFLMNAVRGMRPVHIEVG